MFAVISLASAFKYILVGIAGGLLAKVLKQTFGPNKWFGPIGTLVLAGTFLYGVMFMQYWIFYVSFGAFWFACFNSQYS